MIGTVSRSMNRPDRPAWPMHNVAVLKKNVGRKLCVSSFAFELFGKLVEFFAVLLLLFIGDEFREIDAIFGIVLLHASMRSKAVGNSASSFFQLLGERRMIAVGVGNKRVSDCFVRFKSAQDVIQMALQRRPRVDHSNLSLADQVGACSLVSKRGRVLANNSAD